MNLFALVILYLWLPIVFTIFLLLPPKRAVITAYTIAWLGLPHAGIGIPGLPDYTKMSATVTGVLLCMLIFNSERLFAFRGRWYDLPMLVWCLCPFVTAMSNDMGPYEGAAATLEQLVSWGMPYLVGRLYLNDLDSMRELCLGFVIGGLAYIPLCLFEIRMSPVLAGWIYGVWRWDGVRYGGYRPKVFLGHGLELGLWMTNATMIGYLIWSSGTVKRLRGFSFGWLVIALLVTTILCKSTGSMILMIVGLGAILVTRLTKKSWAIWALMAIPIFYSSTRTTQTWSGREVVEISKVSLGEDRAQSFEYRLDMEDKLIARAMERPILGWGRFSRSNVTNKEGNIVTVQDGFWIIALGTTGMVGLGAMLALTLLPMILTIRRFPVKTWSDPQVAPVVALSMILILTMIDFLSNAMLNPIYAVTIGGVLGQSAVKLSRGLQQAEEGLAFGSDLMSQGRTLEAAREFQRTIQLVSEGDDVKGRQVQAQALDGLGHSLASLGRLDEAEGAFHDGLLVRDWLAAHAPDAGRFQDLAIAREGLARLLIEAGKPLEAVEERRIALATWDALVRDHPRNTEYRDHRLAALNDLAWLLCTDPDPSVYDPSNALDLAEEAARSSSSEETVPWNTLGVARYRTGDWAGAIEALERSALSSLDGLGTAFDHYFLAMAWNRLQHEDQAREWLERGVAWTARHRPGHPALERFRDEAESLLSHENDPPKITRS